MLIFHLQFLNAFFKIHAELDDVLPVENICHFDQPCNGYWIITRNFLL